MSLARSCFLLAAGLAVSINVWGVLRLCKTGVRMAQTWSDGYRSSGEHVDVARSMAAKVLASGGSVAYCQPYDDGLTAVDRSRILAMSWETAPQPVKYGNAQELRGYDAVVASAFGLDMSAEDNLGGEYRMVDYGGGVALWAKAPLRARERYEGNSSACDGVAIVVLALLAWLFFWFGGLEGVGIGVGVISALAFVQVSIFHDVGRLWLGAFAIMAVSAVCLFCGKGATRGYIANCGDNGNVWRWPCIIGAFILLCIYAGLTLTHTYFSPNGLGTVGGKAKLLFLSKGFPAGFFSDRMFMLYQPAYPPGSAMFVLFGYVVSGACDECPVL